MYYVSKILNQLNKRKKRENFSTKTIIWRLSAKGYCAATECLSANEFQQQKQLEFEKGDYLNKTNKEL